MIKRTYFMTVKRYHDDGKGSFAYNSGLYSYTSWLPSTSKVFRDALSDLEKSTGGKGNPHVLAFNKV